MDRIELRRGLYENAKGEKRHVIKLETDWHGCPTRIWWQAQSPGFRHPARGNCAAERFAKWADRQIESK